MMVRRLVSAILKDSAVSFTRNGDSLVVSVIKNGAMSSARFSLEEACKLVDGDLEAADAILCDTIDGLYDESNFKSARDTSLRNRLTEYLDAIAKREYAESNLKEETE